MDLRIVIAVNKTDLWFCRICVASIRYFYPAVEILLLKDELNGKFSTKEIEDKFSVKTYDCGKRIFGWSAAKIFFLLQAEKNKKYLLLDSDIVFIEPFLESILEQFEETDFIVSGDNYKEIYSQHIRETYFDVSKILEMDPNYKYPGFFFNAGQIFITGGLIKEEHLSDFFDMDDYPYWKRLDILPMVDQSLYNYLLPKLNDSNTIQLKSCKYMRWSEGPEAKVLMLDEVIAKNAKGGLIHWAGAKRTPFIQEMTRPDILQFFQNEYYKNDTLKDFKILYRKNHHLFYSYYLRLKRKIKKSFK